MTLGSGAEEAASRPRLSAIVLAGGKSERMGRPKAWLPFGGGPLLARVVDRLMGVADPVVVAAAPDQPLPEFDPRAIVARDAVAGRGPLEGIAAGLRAIAGRAEAAFVVGTDAPFVEPAFVRRLEALRAEGAYDAALVRAGGRPHPLFAVYAIRVLPAVERLLGEGHLRASGLAREVRTRFVGEAELLADPALAAADPELRSLRGVNTPEEYEAALREAGLFEEPG